MCAQEAVNGVSKDLLKQDNTTNEKITSHQRRQKCFILLTGYHLV
jgi:hypothetical protein